MMQKLSMCWPMFVVAVLAAIIASQAMISATFSIIQQSLSLGCFPRVKIVHTSAKYEGQVYIPEINYLLMLACVGVTLVWNNVFRGKYYYELEQKVSSNKLKEILDDTKFFRIPRLALFYSELVHGIPPIFKRYAANVPALHSVLIFVSIETLPISKVPVEERFLFR